MSVDAFPQAIQAIVQNGILDRTFQEALQPNFLYRSLATPRPFQSNLGETVTFTRTGLLAPVTTPLTPGNDPSASNYSIEQYSMSLNQYGNSLDTNMLASSIALASKFLEDNKKLGINAAQSLNQIARMKLYNAYLGGNTYTAAAQGTSSAACVVNDVTGFTTQVVNGVQTPVSGTNPLNITLAGVANTVTAVDTGTKTLTLGTATTWAAGDAVVANVGAAILRPNARSTNQKLTSSDVATMSVFMDAVSKLRQNNVPTFDGYYVAHIDAVTERQLFADADFKQALQGREDSPVWQGLSIGRFGGIDWVRNTEAPTVAGAGGVTVRQPIVVGAEALIEGPLQGFGELLQETNVNRPGIVSMINGIALITRPPMDKLQQVISSTWAWTGDFAVPTDSLTGSTSQFKRAVVVEHAS